MFIRKKHLILACSLLVFLIILFLLYYLKFNLPKTPVITCSTFSERIDKAHCGYISSDYNLTSHRVAGVIIEKKIDKDNYLLKIRTLDSKNNSLNILTSLAPDPLDKWLKVFTPKKEFRPDLKIDPITTLDSKGLFERLSVNQEVIVNIPTPSDLEIKKAKEQYGSLKTFECIEFHNSTVDYLKKSTIASKLSYEIAALTSGCSLGVVEIDIMK